MFSPGDLLQDRYRIIKAIGQGGMGTVYEAEDTRFHGSVAIKETRFDEDRLRRAFAQEARLLFKLRHTALPRVSDYFEEQGVQCIVMEFIEGPDLEAQRRAQPRGAFPPALVLQWADQLLDALDYLHTRRSPIIHRDIKPQNLKLNEQGEIILLDFGLAKTLTEQTTSTAGKSIVGFTHYYASPEQKNGTGTNERSDLYSLAATLYHLLTGQLPPDANVRTTEIFNGGTDPLRPASELTPQVPVAVAEVLHRAMSLKADERPQTAREMRDALRNASPAVEVEKGKPAAPTARKATASEAPTKVKTKGKAAPQPSGADLPTTMIATEARRDAATLDAGRKDESGMAQGAHRVTSHIVVVEDTTPHLGTYLSEVGQLIISGRSTEHSYRAALVRLIESLGKGLQAINEPKRIAAGAPDIVVMHGGTPLGYIEAKDVNAPLDRAHESEQLKRYLRSLGNLILTDYLEFRWYVRGELRLTERLASVGADKRFRSEPGAAKRVGNLLKAFLRERVPTIGSPKELAESMAVRAGLLRDLIRRELETEGEAGTLHQQLKGFQDVLIHDLKPEQFADMYAQTICYGLFAARTNARGSERFTREHAARDLPRTNPFLRRLFQHIAGPELEGEAHEWVVDDIAELLDRADIPAILRDFGKHTRREDPVVHFYETFLAAYDPRLRETRGVYYTPEPVVSYIVRSVDHILRTEFNLPQGLADASRIRVPNAGGKGATETHRVLILDPATGTGTFLYGVINQIYEEFRHSPGMWSGYVTEHLLPRLFGFELLMAPYAVSHLKLDLQLKELGYDFQTNERLRVYLTNTLEEAFDTASKLPFAQWLAEEANEAGRVKQEFPVMVVLGNPPYSGHSANTGEWISGLLRGTDTLTGGATENYFEVDGQPLGERNPKWLNDDYVKFIRFAQWRIEQTGYGVLAFITNHGYLDNPTFRGMRQSLMETFDDIYVLDLHGNSKKKERAPDGSEDENVFDIQQGVAIGIFIKRKDGKEKATAVHHAHLWGLREVYEEKEHGERVLTGGKYHWLSQHDVSTTEWTTLEPQAPFYLFVPQDKEIRREYESMWSTKDVMPVNSVGIVTGRDELSIHSSEESVWKLVTDFANLAPEEARVKYNLGKDSSDWKVSLAQKDLLKSGLKHSNIVPILYRPFDFRWTYYTGNPSGFHCRPRGEVMRHMLEDNLALVSARSNKSTERDHFFASRKITEAKCGERTTQSALFPLYLYPVAAKKSLFDAEHSSSAPGSRRPNLAPEFVADLAGRLKMKFVSDGKGDLEKTFGPEDVFNYMYAVFHSPGYRSRYAEFLKIDFPRLPLTSNQELFRVLCKIGSQLVALHLMEATAPNLPRFPVKGDDMVEAVRYTEPAPGTEQGRVWINRTQYFEGVRPEVWNFHVGGYQVCQKWLKDRKGRKLTFDDLSHYSRIVAALDWTLVYMTSIDLTIGAHGGWPLG